jgi:hypothetical protein
LLSAGPLLAGESVEEVCSMDDSEKSYGYSEDIYHGRHAEKSYEYGAEGETADAQGEELSPEEEAIHIVGPKVEEPEPAPDTPEYDYGREGPYAEVESFTWENPVGKEEQRTGGEESGQEAVGAGSGEAGSKT